MSTSYDCPLGLSPETLSAWRDQLVTPDEMRRIGAHVRECAVCRERLDAFERLAHPLRAERAPEPDERLWLAIRGGMVRMPGRGGAAGGARGVGEPPRRAWSALAAVAAIVLVAIGFAALFGALMSSRKPTSHPTPTVPSRTSPTATHTTGAVAWQTIAWPQGQPGPDNVSLGPSLSQADGNIAYLCQPGATPQDNEQIWGTHNLAAPNHGAQWTHLGDLPVARQAINLCAVVVDTTDPSTLLVTISPQASQTPRNFASFDGGQTWRELSQTPLFFQGPLASYQGKVYAIFSTIVPQYPQFGNYSLFVSSDQMRTWQPLSQRRMDAFWLDGGGEILAHDLDSRQFEYSNDGGQTWYPFQRSLPFDTASFVVRVPAAGQPWTVCGLALPSGASSAAPPNHTALCTQNLGKTITALPLLPDMSAGVPDPAGQMHLLGITSDGSVLAMLAQQAIPKGETSSPGYALWRLSPGGTQWQSLGITPQFSVLYEPGALVASPDSAVIMRPCPTCLADESDYVAAFP